MNCQSLFSGKKIRSSAELSERVVKVKHVGDEYSIRMKKHAI